MKEEECRRKGSFIIQPPAHGFSGFRSLPVCMYACVPHRVLWQHEFQCALAFSEVCKWYNLINGGRDTSPNTHVTHVSCCLCGWHRPGVSFCLVDCGQDWCMLIIGLTKCSPLGPSSCSFCCHSSPGPMTCDGENLSHQVTTWQRGAVECPCLTSGSTEQALVS